jgi:hypothetical protein
MGMRGRTAHAWAKNKQQKEKKEGKRLEGQGKEGKPYEW